MGETDDTLRPAQVGRYRLLARIGAGGMGTVYRAHDPQLNRIVAVKLPQFTGEPELQAQRIQRFQREARAAASVLHPHVCPIFDVGEQEGQPFIVMAFLDGPSLVQRLGKGRFEDVGETVKIVEQLLGGLAAVHAHGIVHRDLKPGNVLFDSDGRAVLTDFGLARPEEGESLTSDGVILGTPSHMAPEQAASQRERIGPWTDLYSLGVIFYQMVTGRLPFEGGILDVLHSIVYEEPPPPAQFRPELDPALEAVILKALRKEPGDRYQSASAFGAALNSFAAGAAALQAPEITARPTELPSAISGHPARHWTWTRALGWVAGGLIIVAMASFLTFLGLRAALESEFGFIILWLVSLGPLSYLGGLLGVSIWGWIEALHVPEGLLHFAREGMMDSARAAISRGISPNVRNYLGETPLLLAAANGHGEIVKLLLLYGANPALPDMFGQTAISAAQAKGYTDIVEVLRSAASRAEFTTSQIIWRPNARLWLTACITVGMILVMGPAYFSSVHPITPEQFVQLAEAKQIRDVRRYVRESDLLLIGELENRLQIGRDPVWLPSKQFWLTAKVSSEQWLVIAEQGPVFVGVRIDELAREINPSLTHAPERGLDLLCKTESCAI
jgi:tRNA A-37 threonylcarbamoyl transferase component Bud32